MEDFRETLRHAARKKLLFLPHAVKQMARPQRMISAQEVAAVVDQGEIIEDHPDDARGHSFLMLASPDGRPVHVVCAPKDEYLAIITAYVPDPDLWSPDYRRRV